ncbi:MAG: hypothetical protein ABI399_02675, partial [Bauldia sp.]
ILDYGAALGVLVWFGLGLWMGHMGRAFRERRLWAAILYPVWYVGIVEILRIFYWGDARFKIPLIAGPLIVLYLRRAILDRSPAGRSQVKVWRRTAIPDTRGVPLRY